MKTLEQAVHLPAEDRRLLVCIKKVVRDFLPTATVLLYGSAARAARTPDSDYDVLVLTDGPLSRGEQDAIDAAIYDIQLSEGVLITASFTTKAKWEDHPTMPFYAEVERDGIVL